MCAGPIPVELLRWKFIEGKTVALNTNNGLELPTNIGELGDRVQSLDLSNYNLRGACVFRVAPVLHKKANTECSRAFLWCMRHAGELPLELIRMKAKGCIVFLRGNEPPAGFTLPSNIGELGNDITKLDLSNCSLRGAVFMYDHINTKFHEPTRRTIAEGDARITRDAAARA